MDITYKVSPTFTRFHADTNKLKFIMGPVGSGKSSGCIFDLFFNAIKQRPDKDGVRHSRYAVIRATYPQLKSSTIKTFIEWFKDKISLVYSTPILGRLQYDLSDGTSIDMEIMFVAIDDEQCAEKLRSWEFTGAWINEAHEVPEYLVGTILRERVNRYPAIRSGGAICSQIICDYNACSTDHWLYKWAEELKPEGCSFYKQPPAVLKDSDGNYKVNPFAENLENLPEEYYPSIWSTSSPEVINTDLMNNYGERKSGKPVYKDFNDNEHVVSSEIKPPSGVQVVIAMDQGLNPAACFTFQDEYGAFCVFDEIISFNCSLKEFCEDLLWPRIRSKWSWIQGNFKVVVDPAASQRSQNDARAGFDIIKEAGFPVILAKSNVATERREAVIHFLLKKGKFKLSPVCSFLRKGFITGYRYEERLSHIGPAFKDKPEKNEFSHIHDALQYAAMEFLPKAQKKYKFKQKYSYTAASTIGGY